MWPMILVLDRQAQQVHCTVRIVQGLILKSDLNLHHTSQYLRQSSIIQMVWKFDSQIHQVREYSTAECSYQLKLRKNYDGVYHYLLFINGNDII
jgi:hypothetical protein